MTGEERMRVTRLMVLSVLMIAIAVLAPESSLAQENMPEFYMNPPGDTADTLYVARSAASTEKDLSVSKAKTVLAQGFGKKLEHVALYIEEMSAEAAAGQRRSMNGLRPNWREKELSDDRLQFIKEHMAISQKETSQSGGRYVTFLLGSIPTSKALDFIEKSLDEETLNYYRDNDGRKKLLERLSEDSSDY